MEGPQWSRDRPGGAGGLGFLSRELLGMLLWGLFPLLFPNCLNCSGFHMLAQPSWTSQLWNCPRGRTSVTHQGTAHPWGQGQTLPLPGHLMELQRLSSLSKDSRDDPKSHSTGTGFPSRAQPSSWEMSFSGQGQDLDPAGQTLGLFWGIPNLQLEPPRAARLSPDSTKLLSCCKVSLNWFLHPALLANFLLCHQRPDLIRQECALV